MSKQRLFGTDGVRGVATKKLPDSVEDELEAIMCALSGIAAPRGGGIGRIHETRDPVQFYLDRIEATAGGREAVPLHGVSLVMDCANGAAYEQAPRLFRDL